VSAIVIMSSLRTPTLFINGASISVEIVAVNRPNGASVTFRSSLIFEKSVRKSFPLHGSTVLCKISVQAIIRNAIV
jgi:hypothetical protein